MTPYKDNDTDRGGVGEAIPPLSELLGFDALEHSDIKKQIERLQRERDALLAAANKVASFARKQPWTGLGDSVLYGEDLRNTLAAAIALAEGRTA